MSNLTSVFLTGFAAAAFAASGLFFFKFYKASRDRFFLCFGVGCMLIAIERTVGALMTRPVLAPGDPISDALIGVYAIRLVAFLAILLGIWIKNQRRA